MGRLGFLRVIRGGTGDKVDRMFKSHKKKNMGRLGFEPRSSGLEPPILARLNYLPVSVSSITSVFKSFVHRI